MGKKIEALFRKHTTYITRRVDLEAMNSFTEKMRRATDENYVEVVNKTIEYLELTKAAMLDSEHATPLGAQAGKLAHKAVAL